MKINFELDKTHQCTSYRLGDTIVWRCPICTNYERTLNLTTGEMKVKGKTGHLHTGSNSGEQDMEGLTKLNDEKNN